MSDNLGWYVGKSGGIISTHWICWEFPSRTHHPCKKKTSSPYSPSNFLNKLPRNTVGVVYSCPPVPGICILWISNLPNLSLKSCHWVGIHPTTMCSCYTLFRFTTICLKAYAFRHSHLGVALIHIKIKH